MGLIIFLILCYVFYTIINVIIQFVISIPWWVYVLILVEIMLTIITLWITFSKKETKYQEESFNKVVTQIVYRQKQLLEPREKIIEKEQLYIIHELWKMHNFNKK